MVFIETTNFTKAIRNLITDDSYAALQNTLSINPGRGSLIEGTGGLRKIRWKSSDKGKRGGIRIIYYWHVRNHQILFLLVYSKSVKDDLTHKQKQQLKALVQEELDNGR